MSDYGSPIHIHRGYSFLKRLNRSVFLLCLLLSGTMIVDFLIDGEVVVETVTDEYMYRVEHSRRSGNNRRFYKIATPQRDFQASYGFMEQVKVGDRLRIHISSLFNEVNKTEILETGESETYPQRWLFGLGLPILFIVLLISGHLFGRKNGILIFVVETVVLGLFIYLQFY